MFRAQAHAIPTMSHNAEALTPSHLSQRMNGAAVVSSLPHDFDVAPYYEERQLEDEENGPTHRHDHQAEQGNERRRDDDQKFVWTARALMDAHNADERGLGTTSDGNTRRHTRLLWEGCDNFSPPLTNTHTHHYSYTRQPQTQSHILQSPHITTHACWDVHATTTSPKTIRAATTIPTARIPRCTAAAGG